MAYVLGQRKPAFILLPEPPLGEPELMYRLPGVTIVADIPELITRLRQSPTIRKIYVASSWTRSANHPAVITAARAAGFEVFDYRATPNHTGEIDARRLHGALPETPARSGYATQEAPQARPLVGVRPARPHRYGGPRGHEGGRRRVPERRATRGGDVGPGSQQEA